MRRFFASLLTLAVVVTCQAASTLIDLTNFPAATPTAADTVIGLQSNKARQFPALPVNRLLDLEAYKAFGQVAAESYKKNLFYFYGQADPPSGLTGEPGWTASLLYPGGNDLFDETDMFDGVLELVTAADLNSRLLSYANNTVGGRIRSGLNASGACDGGATFDWPNLQFVKLLYQYWTKTGDKTVLSSYLGTVTNALNKIILTNGLPYYRTNFLVLYKDCDGLRSRGYDLLGSVFWFDVHRMLAEIAVACGSNTFAATCSNRMGAVQASLQTNLWDSTAGLFRAWSVTNKQHGLWGNAYGVCSGCITGAYRAAVLTNFVAHLATGSNAYSLHGALRVIPATETMDESAAIDFQKASFEPFTADWTIQLLHLAGRDDTAFAIANDFMREVCRRASTGGLEFWLSEAKSGDVDYMPAAIFRFLGRLQKLLPATTAGISYTPAPSIPFKVDNPIGSAQDFLQFRSGPDPDGQFNFAGRFNSNGVYSGSIRGNASTATLATNLATPDWSFIVIPDSQGITVPESSNLWSGAMQWIVTNRTQLNLKMVLHVGDVVNDATNAQWITSYPGLNNIASNTPLLLVPGNHDYDGENVARGNLTAWQTNYGQGFYTNRSWWTGGFASNGASENLFFTNTIYGQKFLWLGLEFGPRTNTLVWASNIMQTFPDHKVILWTHSYLASSGYRTTEGIQWAAKSIIGDAANGDGIWAYLSFSPNLLAVFCGHDICANAARNQSIGISGNEVHEVFFNRQCNLDDYFRIYTVSEARGLIYAATYAPSLSTYLKDDQNSFAFPIRPSTGRAISSQVSMRSGQDFVPVNNMTTPNGTWSYGIETNTNFKIAFGVSSPSSNSAILTLQTNGLLLMPGGIVSDCLLAYLPLNEGQGQYTFDESGFKNVWAGHLSASNCFSWTNGIKGFGLNCPSNVGDFFSTQPSMTLPNFSGLSTISVSLWFKAYSVNHNLRILISKTSGGTSGECYLALSDSGARLQVTTINALSQRIDSYFSLPYSPDDGIWHQAGFTYQSGAVVGYYDGLPLGTDTQQSGPLKTTATPVILGTYNWGYSYNFDGALDEVKIWSRVLSPQEMLSAYGKVRAGQ